MPPSSSNGDSLLFKPGDLLRVATDVFVACGAPAQEAQIVAEELVDASLMGLDSHGVIRVVQYASDALAGKITPGAAVTIIKETPSTAIVDCGFNFGPFTARRMVDIVCEKARTNQVACVVSRNSHHVSRLGSYVQRIAQQHGLIGLGTANSSRHGHFVVPWGGREGRLSTNPLAFAAPSGGDPVVLDMSTSMIAEGKIRLLRDQGKPIPPDCVQDAGGHVTTDPEAFYGPPRGMIRPFGGSLGYKGFGLGLMVEILGGVLAGCVTREDLPYINGLCLFAINPEAFCGSDRFKELMDDLTTYITDTPPAPGFEEVVMPGALDFRIRHKRMAEGIPLAEATWRQIETMADKLGVTLSQSVSQDDR